MTFRAINSKIYINTFEVELDIPLAKPLMIALMLFVDNTVLDKKVENANE